MLNLTLERIERQIRNLPVEHVYVLGADNQILFHHTDDEPDQVTYPMRVLAALDIAVVTHNHPRGRSFSRRDVLLAREARLKELRAVTPRQRFSLMPPVAGWESIGLDELNEGIRREEDLLSRAVRGEIQRGVITPDLVSRTFHHRLWERVASVGLIRYSAENW